VPGTPEGNAATADSLTAIAVLQQGMQQGNHSPQQQNCFGATVEQAAYVNNPGGYTGSNKGIRNTQPEQHDQQNHRYVQQYGDRAATACYKIQTSVTAWYVHGGVSPV
jgi:hypothetical protein